jgi:hypothetical protein
MSRGPYRVVGPRSPILGAMVLPYVVALLLQVVGSVIIGWEVWDGHQRWTQRFGPRAVSGSINVDLQGATARFRGRADGIVGNLTVEERLDRLEAGLVEERDARIEQGWQSEDRMAETADAAAQRVEAALTPRISEAVSYLAGLGERPTLRPWWLGPALVLAGTILGGIASVMGAL